MTVQTELRAADRALKEKHRSMWALGDYPTVASQVIPTLGPILVEACRIDADDRVLDVAAGSGNVAIPAALTGATVIANDLTPELLEAGAAVAGQHGLDLRWETGDAEALPYPDDEFDVVTSCVGVMFAPHHGDAAAELVRVCRPGGRIGLVSWTPEGFIGQMLATMRPYVAAPPPGAQPPPLWGKEDHVLGLLGARVVDVRTERRTVRVDRFTTPEDFREFFKSNYGPTIAAYRGLADHPHRAAALDRDLAELARRHALGAGSLVMDWEYLLLTARKRG